ncbi:hypothetical protein FRUB_04778 [Fimbriiglobus ruber]|uniref:Uncharacterized protein n=1 Tax=Fimbriiglobus ruber TaxID=1908690 RepID=A0A225DTI1_9BACT|nr:hypothetical protein FRUB_04778 [Fimbriiglobus ruber]
MYWRTVPHPTCPGRSGGDVPLAGNRAAVQTASGASADELRRVADLAMRARPG